MKSLVDDTAELETEQIETPLAAVIPSQPKSNKTIILLILVLVGLVAFYMYQKINKNEQSN
jgi:hypothetical protein